MPPWPWRLPLLTTLPAGAADPVRIGEINSYTGLPAFTIPTVRAGSWRSRKVNAKGGVLGGRMLEVISRDDAGKPDDAVRVANELVSNEKVDILAGDLFQPYRAGGQRLSRCAARRCSSRPNR